MLWSLAEQNGGPCSGEVSVLPADEGHVSSKPGASAGAVGDGWRGAVVMQACLQPCRSQDRAFTTYLIKVIQVFITILLLTIHYRSFSFHICLHIIFCILEILGESSKGDATACTEYLLCLWYRLHSKSIHALRVEAELS